MRRPLSFCVVHFAWSRLVCLPDLRAAGDLRCKSDHLHAVIVVERAVAGDVGPVPIPVIAIFRSTAQLLFGDACAIYAETGVIFERLPGQRIMVATKPEETAETKHRV